jgi:hypothetical protein
MVQETAMTAIGVVGTASGFIIGADGRMRFDDQSRATADAAALAKETEKAQKIWEIAGSDRTLAYAVAGSILNLQNFDLLRIIREQVQSIGSQDFHDCYEYLRALAREIGSAINEARRTGKIPKFPEVHHVEESVAWEIADAVVCGYFKNCASLIQVRFFHFNQIANSRLIQYPPAYTLLLGSIVVERAMYSDNSPFTKYVAEPIKGLRSPTLDEAAQFVQGYLEACKSPLALQMNPETCKMIGGHIHVAEITPTGFRWRIPPLS